MLASPVFLLSRRKASEASPVFLIIIRVQQRKCWFWSTEQIGSVFSSLESIHVGRTLEWYNFLTAGKVSIRSHLVQRKELGMMPQTASLGKIYPMERLIGPMKVCKPWAVLMKFVLFTWHSFFPR